MNTKMKLFYLLPLFLICLGLLPSQSLSQAPVSAVSPAPETDAPAAMSAAHPLQISPGDLLEVVVFDTSELSAKLRVDERGNIALPVAGDFGVSGLTAPDASRAIETKFLSSDILKNPHVSITILEYATQGVTILGEVRNPGVYPLLGVHNLLDLISAAGGMTPNAGKAISITHRGQPSRPITVKLDAKTGNSDAFNVDVRPGDTIMVSRMGIVYVLGEVGKPGGFMLENSNRLTVLQAVALAQGTTRTASLNRARLLRNSDDGREELTIPLQKILANKAPDQALDDGDILFVPSSAAKVTLRTIETILPAAAGAAIYRVP